MTEHQILEGVRQVIREHLQVHAPVEQVEQVERETDLFRDLQLDSLKQLTLVVELENHFRVRFDAGDEEGLATVGDLVRLIERRLSQSHRSA
jgi:acyl carrier protein